MIIGLMGSAGSGKSTAGTFLHEDFAFHKRSFAGTLKDAVSAIFSWDRELLEGETPESREWREKEDEYWTKALGYRVTPRIILQKFGTNACRNVLGSDIWLHSLFRSMEDGIDYVVTDVRFPNEIKAIRERGGKLVLIKRGNEPDWIKYAMNAKCHMNANQDIKPATVLADYFKGDPKVPRLHISEWAWVGAPVDYTMANHHNLLTLRSNVATMAIHFDPRYKQCIQNNNEDKQRNN